MSFKKSVFPGAVGYQRAVGSQEQWGLRVIKGLRTKEKNTDHCGVGNHRKVGESVSGSLGNKEDCRAAGTRAISQDTGALRAVPFPERQRQGRSLCAGQQPGSRLLPTAFFLPILV